MSQQLGRTDLAPGTLDTRDVQHDGADLVALDEGQLADVTGGDRWCAEQNCVHVGIFKVCYQ